LAAALTVVGERWSLLALREMTYGVHRFDQIAAYTGATRDILARRLRTLEAAGVVERRQYTEHPPRYEYHLTPAGHDLYPVLQGLWDWGEAYVNPAPPVELRHECGERLHVNHSCSACGGAVTATTVRTTRRRR
jgi:DNA-binding HxlR family transcriptional regulator